MKPTIVSIVGTSRPGNFTRHALAVVEDEIVRRGAEVAHKDAAELTLAFPGFPETADGKRLREQVTASAEVSSSRSFLRDCV